jgi:DNA-binding transcriptional regulator GbsR (MarR family)
VLNIENKKARVEKADEDLRLVIADDIGHLYARYGLALSIGRVLGLLLASDEPLTLDEIAQVLGISKSGASVAARDLERIGVVIRRGTSGSKRVVYEATEQMESTFTGTFARITDSLQAMNRAESRLRPGKAKRRMKEMVEVHEFWLRESNDMMERWRRRRQSR